MKKILSEGPVEATFKYKDKEGRDTTLTCVLDGLEVGAESIEIDYSKMLPDELLDMGMRCFSNKMRVVIRETELIMDPDTYRYAKIKTAAHA